MAGFAGKKYMIQEEEIERLVAKSQTSRINVYREYCQHLFLSYLYRQKEAGNTLFFKGGTALKLIYGSPRFSEDLDFSSPEGNVGKIENIVESTLKEIEGEAIKIDITESKKTIGGYLAIIEFNLASHKIPLKIEVSFREKKVKGEVTNINSEFITPYTIIMFSKKDLVGQKIQALLIRAKPRDFYDLYFLIRAGLLGKEEKDSLGKIFALVQKTDISFKKELQQFLPKSHWILIKDFKNALIRELERFIPLRETPRA